ncbi:hypothetical protein BU23DRAFT_564991 [Bimuria novae-zelandiae CBS 107.79]|uniref:Uncharacterized protein n=1 Tax=Bimuria novae-zelandiae CBS 107.79 TaxID=1447943 RepID=A0A6A5VLR6_9PLEO|nr:hypothetical protein BU23DRAFT_564991 [Bimuria novae-zelandiae CBS 107.79]
MASSSSTSSEGPQKGGLIQDASPVTQHGMPPTPERTHPHPSTTADGDDFAFYEGAACIRQSRVKKGCGDSLQHYLQAQALRSDLWGVGGRRINYNDDDGQSAVAACFAYSRQFYGTIAASLRKKMKLTIEDPIAPLPPPPQPHQAGDSVPGSPLDPIWKPS